MSSPEKADAENVDGIVAANELHPELTTEQGLMRQLRQEFTRYERNKRRAAFGLAKNAVGSLRDLSLSLSGLPQSYHRTYFGAEDGATIQRSVAFRILDFPGPGPLARLIVNDIGPNSQDINGRRLTIQDYIISLTSRTFTWQESNLSRTHLDNAWQLTAWTGPLLEQRADSVDMRSGASYNLRLPKVGGWPTPLHASIVNRMQLEHATDVMASLDVSTYQPGYRLLDKL